MSLCKLQISIKIGVQFASIEEKEHLPNNYLKIELNSYSSHKGTVNGI